MFRISTSYFLCGCFFGCWGQIHFIAVKFFIHSQPEFMLQIAFHIKSVLLIEVRQFFVSLMLGNVEFVAQEWSDSAQLQDALAAMRCFHQTFITQVSTNDDTGRIQVGLYPISRYNRRIDAGYLHFCPINITFKWVMNKTPRKMYKTKRPPMYKSAVIKSYIS